MAIIKNAITFGSGFNITAQGPIDSRSIVENISDLTTVWGSDAPSYEGMIVLVLEDNNLYTLIDDDSSLSGNWKQIGSGSASDISALQQKVNTIEDIVGATAEDGLQKTVADNTATIATKQDMLSAGEAISISENVVDVKIDPSSTSGVLTKSAEGLKVTIPTASEYTIAVSSETTEGALKSYELQKNGVKVGVSIDIPKDLVVSNGEVKIVEEVDVPYSGAKIGDLYLQLTIANQASPVIIPVNKLTDVYTAGAYLTLSDAEFSVNYDQLKTQLDTDLEITTISNKVSTLESTVGSEESGLVKDVSDIKVTLGDGVTSGVVKDVSDLKTNTSELSDKVDTLETSVGKIKVKDVDTTGVSGISLALDSNAGKVKIGSVAGDTLSESLNADKIKIKTEVTGGVNIPTESTITVALQSLSDAIQTATSGGITSIVGDEYISVSGEGTTKNVSFNVNELVQETSCISVQNGKLDIFWENF